MMNPDIQNQTSDVRCCWVSRRRVQRGVNKIHVGDDFVEKLSDTSWERVGDGVFCPPVLTQQREGKLQSHAGAIKENQSLPELVVELD